MKKKTTYVTRIPHHLTALATENWSDYCAAKYIQLETGTKLRRVVTSKFSPEKCRLCYGRKASSGICLRLPFCGVLSPVGNSYYKKVS